MFRSIFLRSYYSLPLVLFIFQIQITLVGIASFFQDIELLLLLILIVEVGLSYNHANYSRDLIMYHNRTIATIGDAVTVEPLSVHSINNISNHGNCLYNHNYSDVNTHSDQVNKNYSQLRVVNSKKRRYVECHLYKGGFANKMFGLVSSFVIAALLDATLICTLI